MFKSFTPAQLTPVAAGAAIALVVFAVFAWTQSAAVIDSDPDAGSPWPWRLWQLVGVIIAGAGVWMLARCTGRVPRTHALALGLYALAIFVNAYTPGFGDYYGRVWLTANPLFIAFAAVTSPILWRCRCVAGYVGAALMAAMGLVVLVNGYFIDLDTHVVWDIMNPLMLLTALAWIIGINQANGGKSASGE